ncbi:uncharacterized protein LOC132932171 isoform X1 [Rhopalosiphum padi]|uniref:uncharacterized protein LOC132932171 isoform X1 n=1 Tax=Rhopalosiphum padi TaxID=40932 RepID=UPI00298E1B08|nr:uncharacterized protein LOC132932171 isoform X1 [Rhopalosiphum padi]
MKVHMMFALCALMIPYLPLQCRCNCCLDTVIKSIFQTFNPSVEAGPERIISRHRYDDGFMPEYPAAVIGHDGKWVKPHDDDYDDDDDSGSVPSADYVDDGASSGSGTSSGKGGGGKSGDSGGRRLGYSIQQHKSDAAVAAASAGSGPVTRPDDYRPFSDFIVSVLQTVQLTPQAILKKSKGKSDEARAAKTTTVQPESHDRIPGTW